MTAYYEMLAGIFGGDHARAVLFQASLNGIVHFLILQPELKRRRAEFPLAAMRERLISTSLRDKP